VSEGSRNVAEAAAEWIESQGRAADLWRHEVHESAGPESAEVFEAELEGWTVRLSRIAWDNPSGYGHYFSVSRRERYLLVVSDPAGDVVGWTGDSGTESRLGNAFQRVKGEHERAHIAAAAEFLRIAGRPRGRTIAE
jgi:hypothetical protein